MTVTISVTELRKRLNHYIDLVQQGMDVIITRYGKPVAVLIHPDKYNKAQMVVEGDPE